MNKVTLRPSVHKEDQSRSVNFQALQEAIEDGRNESANPDLRCSTMISGGRERNNANATEIRNSQTESKTGVIWDVTNMRTLGKEVKDIHNIYSNGDSLS